MITLLYIPIELYRGLNTTGFHPGSHNVVHNFLDVDLLRRGVYGDGVVKGPADLSGYILGAIFFSLAARFEGLAHGTLRDCVCNNEIRMALMETYYMLVRVAPVKGNRLFGKFPGAYANIFVTEFSKEDAWSVAQSYLEHNHWIATLDEEIEEITAEHQFPTEESKHLFDESRLVGIAVRFVEFEKRVV